MSVPRRTRKPTPPAGTTTERDDAPLARHRGAYLNFTGDEDQIRVRA